MKLATLGLAALLVLSLSACAADPLAEQYASGSGQGYISSNGVYAEIPADKRDAPVTFSSSDFTGATVSSGDYLGKAYVVNFWFAGCGPCRVEAPILSSLSSSNPDVPFLGVNVYDSADTARVFQAGHELAYPSIIDSNTNSVQLAFAGSVAPNAVPTTLVVDAQGRVAARISGAIRDPSILTDMIDKVVAEDH